ncbi:PD-(D/E)XK nuclease family protein [Actinoplanes sp. NPDC051343]|uniref:PD-(D/E)XK nuclease family protein n=1 Tax=Actinoplanes sp. NPDC051343 TaxID=3363906 RepID=UPI0037B8604B
MKITASDVDSAERCPQQGYVKSRKPSRIVGPLAWEKRWDADPIPLKHFLTALGAYLYSGSLPERDRMSRSRRTYARAHPGVRTFLDHALDNYLDFLGSRERPGIRARYLGFDTEFRVARGGALAVWAPVYEIGPGHVEVHRLRIRRTHPELTGWAQLAAYAVSQAHGAASVSVVDVSLYHDPAVARHESVLVDRISAGEAEAIYLADVRPHVMATVQGGPPSTGHGCGDCLVAGVCDALIPMDRALMQTGPGPYLRSISANELFVYERCPAQWFLEKKTRLPLVTDRADNAATSRGRGVHDWLKVAHRRGRPCTADDLPLPADRSPQHVGFTALDDQQYAAAFPFLLTHLEQCPLAGGGEVLVADETLYGWDATADTVIAGRPDLLYRRDGILVLRETKSTEGPVAKDPDDARDGFDGIVYWWLRMMQAGYLQHFGATSGRVELEILGPDESICHSYPTDDEDLEIIAETRVRHLVADWHADTTWASRSNPLCTRCPVAVWCPDRDQYATRVAAAGTPF